MAGVVELVIVAQIGPAFFDLAANVPGVEVPVRQLCLGIKLGDFPLMLSLVLVKFHSFLVQNMLYGIGTNLIVGIEGI